MTNLGCPVCYAGTRVNYLSSRHWPVEASSLTPTCLSGRLRSDFMTGQGHAYMCSVPAVRKAERVPSLGSGIVIAALIFLCFPYLPPEFLE